MLLNRSGWSNFLSCRECARVWECPNCDVTLVLHRTRAEVACHHCGHREPVPGSCPDCGSVSVARHGAGTEQLERELEELVAPLPVFRLDADAAAAAGVASVLQRFDGAPAGVLVGTQMVAKGHDFPDVTLGVVLDADATLRFPDFRAEERTFALVAQLAGRSGRGPRGGRVIVQALDPGARALRHAARHDADRFLNGELERREALGYPPFGQPDPGGLLVRRARPGAGRCRRGPRARRRPRAFRCSGPRRCSAVRRATGPSSWSARGSGRAHRGRARRRRGRCGRARARRGELRRRRRPPVDAGRGRLCPPR